MSEPQEVSLTPDQARATFAVMSWADVRMISFDLAFFEVLLHDGRRIKVQLDKSDDAYEILAEFRKDRRDDERGT